MKTMTVWRLRQNEGQADFEVADLSDCNRSPDSAHKALCLSRADELAPRGIAYLVRGAFLIHPDLQPRARFKAKEMEHLNKVQSRPEVG